MMILEFNLDLNSQFRANRDLKATLLLDLNNNNHHNSNKSSNKSNSNSNEK